MSAKTLDETFTAHIPLRHGAWIQLSTGHIFSHHGSLTPFGTLAFLSRAPLGSTLVISLDASVNTCTSKRERSAEAFDGSLFLLDWDDVLEGNPEEHLQGSLGGNSSTSRLKRPRYSAGAPVSAAHLQRIFRSHRQRLLCEQLGNQQGAPTDSRNHHATANTAKTTSASQADLEALTWLLPAMHHGVLYTSAQSFVEHCQSSEEHFIACEDLPVIPLTQGPSTEAPCACKSPADAPDTGLAWSQGQGTLQCPAAAWTTPLHSFSNETSIWFSLVHKAMTSQLESGLLSDALVRIGDDHMDVATRRFIACRLARAVAKPVATALDPAHLGDSERDAAPPSDSGSSGAAAPANSTPYVDWSSLMDALAEVERLYFVEWERLREDGAVQAAAGQTAVPFLMDLLRPVTHDDTTTSTSSPVDTVAHSLHRIGPHPPSDICATCFPVAQAIVCEVRRQHLLSRLLALQLGECTVRNHRSSCVDKEGAVFEDSAVGTPITDAPAASSRENSTDNGFEEKEASDSLTPSNTSVDYSHGRIDSQRERDMELSIALPQHNEASVVREPTDFEKCTELILLILLSESQMR